MGKAVIQQPNGKFCIFSSITDSIVVYDATEDEVIGYVVSEAAESAVATARHMIQRANGELPRLRHHPTFEEAIEDNNRRYPEDFIDPKALS